MNEKANEPTKTKLLDKIKNNKKLQYFIVGTLLILIFLISFSGIIKTEKETSNSNTVSNYVTGLENQLTTLLSNVDGVGEVNVAISVQSGMETVIASSIKETHTENGLEREETPIILNGKPIVLKEKYPEITGVLIVAEGANNIAVRTRIQQATISLLDININRVEILTMK